MSRFLTVTLLEDANEEHVYLPAGELDAGGYTTLCGLDGGLSDTAMETKPTPRGAKVNCPNCWAIFKTCRSYRATDFDPAVKQE
ncbi:hypothetical protein MNY66_16465 (plasmid) [Moellerella wisconsensis]|uniref:Uncharacterized protein n=1 Tax=Moellerella wisconsensis TaxID=158849 RepID=A0ACD3YC58_9GAMM|nr:MULTISPECIES: hypothetical protein [Morganellaceae]QCJ72218.1 hypothetical protein C9446_20675 [Providencia heimbachae]UNH40636.1 hypothetical protein MNY70_17515 [Moellerella wisconsensis]UNH44340.1 hypothetical protein MNY66_16465 [Moellerella wisconsensis]